MGIHTCLDTSGILFPIGEETPGKIKKREQIDALMEVTDLILLDIVMPEMDGFEVFEHIKELENAKFKDTVTIEPIVSNDCGMHKNDNGKTTVPTAGIKSDLICYTRSELQSKIKRSLDIAAEADQMTERYKALLEVCTKNE